MFRPQLRRQTKLTTGYGMLELVFHMSIRNLRKSHGNAVLGLAMSIIQAMMLVLIMYLIFSLFGLRRTAIRGDFLLYVMSGVFMFMTHVKALGAVAGADGPTSSMMMHAPMNPIISISAAAVASLYQQVLAAAVILLFYHTMFNPITIDDPVGMMAMFLLSWFSGVGIGMIFMAAKPWQPETVGIIVSIYQRANMIASGKMLMANATPASTRALFDWNPLFHTIDQGRGFIFLNYGPRYTSIEYPIYVAMTCMMIGLMAEYFTRQYASASWGKGR
jgi:ABC-type polysaccharide/polyol phosphate export permease